VLHDRELTYTFCAPVKLLGGARSTYVAVNRALVAGLRRIGVPAALARDAQRGRFGTVQPCFAEPAAGEVVVGGLKLVGSAQRCERHTILQHGSILLEGTQAEIAHMVSVPFDLSERATSVFAVLGKATDLGELTAAIAAGFEEACGICLAPARLSPSLEARVVELEQLYASPDWTWRR
jgi:lipoate-protein ligase A